MNIGYASISTDKQDLSLQKDALRTANCKRIYEDAASGSLESRKGLHLALDNLRAGDTLVVWRLDRLARSLKHLIEIINDLQSHEIGFKSLQENVDTTSSGGKLVFHIFAALARFERELIQERTRTGLTAARARGRVGGRPSKVNAKVLSAARTLLKQPDMSVNQVCKTLGISRATLYRHLSHTGDT